MTPSPPFEDPDVAAFENADYDIGTLTPANVKIVRDSGPKSALSVRLDSQDIERLRQRAEAEGIGLTQLVRQWILERLDEPPAPAAVDELVEALEESLRAARAFRRSTHSAS